MQYLFIRADITNRELSIGNEQEYVTVKIWTSEGEFVIINYYNLCRKLDLSRLKQIEGLDGNRVLVCWDAQ